jgi:hypothetical protein
MAEGRLPKTELKWMLKQKRARGRPKKNWMEGIRKAVNERNPVTFCDYIRCETFLQLLKKHVCFIVKLKILHKGF